MLSYIFFHQKPFQLFVDFLHDKQLSPESSQENECYEVAIPEDIEDKLSEEIEDEYDTLFEMNQNLMDRKRSSENNYAMASIDIPLGDGSISQANINPDLINKVLSVLTPQQLSEVVAIIVDAVENPDSRTFCQRVREDDAFSK